MVKCMELAHGSVTKTDISLMLTIVQVELTREIARTGGPI